MANYILSLLSSENASVSRYNKTKSEVSKERKNGREWMDGRRMNGEKRERKRKSVRRMCVTLPRN